MTKSHAPDFIRQMNLILVTICLLTLIAATTIIVIWIWSENDISKTMGKALTTIGLVCVSSLMGLMINSIIGRHLQQTLPKICWSCSWICIVVGAAIATIAVWWQSSNDDVVWRTFGTVVVIFIASTITTVLASALSVSDRSITNQNA